MSLNHHNVKHDLSSTLFVHYTSLKLEKTNRKIFIQAYKILSISSQLVEYLLSAKTEF